MKLILSIPLLTHNGVLFMNKRAYQSPVVTVSSLSDEDILLGSDVIIDGSTLWQENDN